MKGALGRDREGSHVRESENSYIRQSFQWTRHIFHHQNDGHPYQQEKSQSRLRSFESVPGICGEYEVWIRCKVTPWRFVQK